MPPSKKRAVVFDFDGVVADSWRMHEKAWQDVLKRHQLQLDDEALHKSIGWNSLETAEILKKELDVPLSAEELAREKFDLARDRWVKEVPKMPGIDAAIKRLRGDYALGLASGRPAEIVKPALKQYGLADAFAVVMTHDDYEKGEELDDLLAKACKKLGPKPEGCVMVDDSRNGLLAAERAGLKTIALNANDDHDVDYSMADTVIKSLDELVPELIQAVTAN